jgi:hypothetical protein
MFCIGIDLGGTKIKRCFLGFIDVQSPSPKIRCPPSWVKGKFGARGSSSHRIDKAIARVQAQVDAGFVAGVRAAEKVDA